MSSNHICRRHENYCGQSRFQSKSEDQISPPGPTLITNKTNLKKKLNKNAFYLIADVYSKNFGRSAERPQFSVYQGQPSDMMIEFREWPRCTTVKYEKEKVSILSSPSYCGASFSLFLFALAAKRKKCCYLLFIKICPLLLTENNNRLF